nr:MAG TPA_asm: hypothetical protein [Caudoviricetes sp.]
MKELIDKEDVLKLLYDVKDNPSIPKNYGTIMDLIIQVRSIPVLLDVDYASEKFLEKYHQTCFEIECEGHCENCGHQKFKNYVIDILGGKPYV